MQTERWDTFTQAGRRVIRFGAVFVSAVLLTGVLTFAGRTALRNGLADPAELTSQAVLMISFTMLRLVRLVCGIGLFVVTVVWMISAHRVTPAGPGLTGHAGAALCLVFNLMSFDLPNRMPSMELAVLLDSAMRIGATALLVAGVLLTRSRLRRQTGHLDPAGRR